MSKDVSDIIRSINASVKQLSKPIRSLRRRLGKNKINKRVRLKVHKSWRWRVEEMPCNHMSQTNNQMFLGLSDIGDHIKSTIIQKRTELGLSMFVDDFSVLATRDQWFKFLRTVYDNYQVIQLQDTYGILIGEEPEPYFITYNVHSSTIGVEIHADQEVCERIGGIIRDKFEEVLTEIEWIYSTDGASIDIPLRADRQPVAEMYPFLGEESLEDYYDRFMDSPASILLLIGPPGTGKTSFIRGLMQHTQSSAVVTYDENILSKDYVFAQFIEGSQNMMVIEDADMFLRARSDGNSTMHKFLNIGDGLVTTRNKKLIFSTNLPSTRDVDPALIRPGRCFDVITFDQLTQPQAEKLAERVGVELTETRDKWTIAEVFHKQTFEPVKQTARSKVGFI